jgi:hypothetical protein
MFDWFDAREATEFGVELAEFFSRRVSPQSIPAVEKKPLLRATEVIASLQGKLRRFAVDNRLNVYKKAKLANAFQWYLLDKGYDKEIIEELTKELLKSL